MYASNSCLRSSRGGGVVTAIGVGVVSGMGVPPSGCTPAPPLTGGTGSKVRKWLRSWERRDLKGSY